MDNGNSEKGRKPQVTNKSYNLKMLQKAQELKLVL